MKYLFSQIDKRWAEYELGSSGLTMKEAGCLLTDVAMIITDLMGEEITPEELLLWMNINNGFTPTGELKWSMMLGYPIDKIGFHQGKALEGETQYEIYAVWAGKIKHWILKDGDKWIDPLKGAYISKNYYAFQGDVRLLAGKKLQPIMNYENKIIRNTVNGEYSFVLKGVRRVITAERAGLAAITAIDRGVGKDDIITIPEVEYNKILRGKDF